MSLWIGLGVGLIPTAARPVATTAPVNVVKPSFDGILTQGHAANVNPGAWTGLPSPNFAYSIKRSGVEISTNPDYVWTADDVSAGANAVRVDVTATNDIGPTTAASDPVTIAAPLALSGSPPTATVGVPYTFTPTRTGGHGPYIYGLVGTLPSGLSFNAATGAITGTPVSSGAASLAIGVIDADGLTAEIGPFDLVITTVPEVPNPTGMAFMGDSRTAFGLGVNVSGTTWSSTQAHGQAVSGWLQHEGGNRILRAPGGMYAYASSTTLRQVNALASASVATTGNPAQALTGASSNADAVFNPLSNGEYSVLDNPANVVVYLPAGTNDKSSAYYSGVAPNPIKSMELIAGILDDLQAAEKIVLLGNEMPSGYNMAWAEAKTLAGTTTTPTNTTGFVDGESFGIVGVIDGDTNTPMTKVVGAPGVGQYSLTGTTYTFNATHPSKVFLAYAYGPGATGVYQFTLHEWLQSAAANFVGSNGTDYGVPGALYGRENVFSLDTWGAIADPATTGTATLAKKGSLSDPVHPGQYAGLLAGRAFSDLVDNLWPSLGSEARRPTKNNWRATLASGTLGTVFQQLTLNPLPGVMGALPLTPGAQRVRLVSNLGTWIGVDDGAGKIVGTGFDTTPGRCTIDYATGVIKLYFAAPANTTAASNIIVEQDAENILVNGLFDPAQGTVARPAGITGQDLPSGWSMLALNSELVTALGLGKAAGGIDIALAQVTAPDGTPGIQFTIDGNPGGGLPSLTINPAASLYQPQFRFNAANPDNFRSGVNARLEAGPNGHLYGVYGVSLSNTLTSSTNFTRAYNASSLNAVSGSVGGGSATVPYSDSIIASGPLDMELLIDELSTAGMTPSGLTWRASVSLTPNAPNSCKVTFWAASTRIRN